MLIGQPELKTILSREELRQLHQRILVHYELVALSISDTRHYIQHRINQAGSDGRPTFTAWAYRAIHRYSQGITRVVNNLCDKFMHAAYIEESDEIIFWHIRRAIRDLNLSAKPTPPRALPHLTPSALPRILPPHAPHHLSPQRTSQATRRRRSLHPLRSAQP